mmetsp:Transcript_28878/g.56693  ORF Transcript_28878/g.56693 Transcript_28878/m.56693 type:complete len:368 (-) Transcript_28878:12-1115(-)|eukprot:CAMPEP_0175151624 /NCGR_PEP_ID=MMETSP0087-20121206/18627_1 /TAXON_ID=136419 /ORGANISM="Unknown Unknown, Strain D1" /LENGTH=367 /DNA_ID=CAMNT_0016437897 /DNA_START=23 /DNA_END=1126 /DNA_ORIENTATION=-
MSKKRKDVEDLDEGLEKKQDIGKVVYNDRAHFFNKEHFKGKTLLFYAKEMQELAEDVCCQNSNVVLGGITWKRFADSFPNVLVQNAQVLKFAHVAFLASLHSPEVIFEQLALIYAFPRFFVKSFSIILPFFATGTMERVTQLGEIATAKTLARMLSNTPLTRNGPCTVHILDIHTLQNQFYFSDKVFVRLHKGASLLKRQLQLLPEMQCDKPTISIAFPDEGAHKRFASSFLGFEVIICHKTRNGDKREVQVKEGDCKGRHVVIVDDLVQSGGTLISCADACRTAGAVAVSAFVTHAIFPNRSWEKFVHPVDGQQDHTGSGGFTHFWVTNSNPVTKDLRGKKPFIVISLADLIASKMLPESAHDPSV